MVARIGAWPKKLAVKNCIGYTFDRTQWPKTSKNQNIQTLHKAHLCDMPGAAGALQCSITCCNSLGPIPHRHLSCCIHPVIRSFIYCLNRLHFRITVIHNSLIDSFQLVSWYFFPFFVRLFFCFVVLFGLSPISGGGI